MQSITSFLNYIIGNYRSLLSTEKSVTFQLWAGDEPGGGPPKSNSILGEEKARQDPPRIELCNSLGLL